MGGSSILRSAPSGVVSPLPHGLPHGRRWAVADRPGEGAHGPGANAAFRAVWGRANDRARDQQDAACASRGDVAAFSRLVQEHSDLVYRVAFRVLGARDVPDASQEVWVRVWRNIGRFRGDSAFATWLYRITMNTCLSVRQKEARRQEHQHAGEMPHLLEPPGGEADPEAAALNAERRREIGAALEHVRAEHRAALVLRHIEGLSYAEIAEALRVPDGTAKGWVSRGRAAMLVALTGGAPAPATDGRRIGAR